MTEHLQTNDRRNIQTYALCTFTFSLQTFTIFFRINAFINVYYNFSDVYHIYAIYRHLATDGCKHKRPLTGDLNLARRSRRSAV